MADRNAPVGVFDSGLGGLTVVKEIIRSLPEEKIVYFGDTARVPYGSKSRDTIIHYTEQILAFMKTKEVKAIVIACNTASAYALDAVREKVNVPIIGVVEPGARTAARITENAKIGVIGTEGTVKSGLHGKYIKTLRPAAEVLTKACPLFVPLVEEGWWKDPVTEEVARRYTKELKNSGVDTLIMGCTHYPLLREVLEKVMGEGVRLVDPARETALELKRLLQEKNLFSDGAAGEEKYRFYVSDDPERFLTFGNAVLNLSIPSAEKIDIEEY